VLRSGRRDPSTSPLGFARGFGKKGQAAGARRLFGLSADTAGGADVVEGDGAATEEDKAKRKGSEGKREFVPGVTHQSVVEVDLGNGYGEIDAKGERGNPREQAQEDHQSANKFSEGGEVGRPSRESEAGDQISVVVKSAENLVVTVDEQNRAQGQAHDEKPEGLQTIEVAQVVPPAERKIDYSSGTK
jgi:hypothetical protein